jgi:hypothetical protein
VTWAWSLSELVTLTYVGDPDAVFGPTVTTGTYTDGGANGRFTGCDCSAVPGAAAPTTTTSDVTTYSDEYTTATLESTVVAALATWGSLPAFGSPSSGEVASAELSTDQTSYSILESKYQFAHPVPPNGTYKLAWIERFQPDGGGAPTDTARSYTWDGTIPGGYDPANSATWPMTSIFEVDYPASNGATSLVSLTVDCGGGPITIY